METILQKVSVCELQLEITEPDVSAKINLGNWICSVCKFSTKHGNPDQHEKKGNWFSCMLSFVFTAVQIGGVNFLLFTCCLCILFASIIYFFWNRHEEVVWHKACMRDLILENYSYFEAGDQGTSIHQWKTYLCFSLHQSLFFQRSLSTHPNESQDIFQSESSDLSLTDWWYCTCMRTSCPLYAPADCFAFTTAVALQQFRIAHYLFCSNIWKGKIIPSETHFILLKTDAPFLGICVVFAQFE